MSKSPVPGAGSSSVWGESPVSDWKDWRLLDLEKGGRREGGGQSLQSCENLENGVSKRSHYGYGDDDLVMGKACLNAAIVTSPPLCVPICNHTREPEILPNHLCNVP